MTAENGQNGRTVVRNICVVTGPLFPLGNVAITPSRLGYLLPGEMIMPWHGMPAAIGGMSA